MLEGATRTKTCTIHQNLVILHQVLMYGTKHGNSGMVTQGLFRD